MSKITNRFSPEGRERAVRLVLDAEGQPPSRRQAIVSIATKIGCTPPIPNAWVRKAEVDSGRRAGIPSASSCAPKAKYGGMDVADGQKLKGLDDENAKPKRVLADAVLDNTALEDLLGKEW
jgi:transposase-like protein